MNLFVSRCVVLVCFFLPVIQAANAAQQCLALPGTYGNVTVAGCENDPTNGVINPVSSVFGPDYPYDGVGLGGLANTTISCTYSFSHPVLASSISVDLDAFQFEDAFTVDLDGQAYAFTDTDIAQTPLPPGAKGTDTLVQQSGAIILAPAASVFNGSGKVKVSANQWISSLKLKMLVDETSGGGVSRVCIDDAAPPPPPPFSPATPVPVGVGTAGAATIGILGFAAFLIRRRKGKRQS